MSRAKADKDFQKQLTANRAALTERGLFVDDPEQFPGLAKRLDLTRGLDPEFRIIIYNTKSTTGEKVRCSICPNRTPHYFGFIVRTIGGEAGLVGNDCAETHFGREVWQAATDRHKVTVRRAIGEALRIPAAQQLEALADRLVEWGNSLARTDEFQEECLEFFYDARNQLSRSGAWEMLKRPSFGWFFRGERLSAEILKAAERARRTADELLAANETGQWTLMEHRKFQMLGDSVTKHHRKHQAVIDLQGHPDVWGHIAAIAEHSSPSAYFTFYPQKRHVRAREGSHKAYLAIPEALCGPLPDLDGLLGALPTCD